MWDLVRMKGPRRRMRVAIGVLVVCGASMLGLTACTVPVAGSTGVTVDRAGNPVLVFALCNAHIDGATIYRDRTETDPVGDDPGISIGTWELVAQMTSARRVDLNTAAPSQSWRPRGSREAVRQGVRYTAYGWTHDNSWSTGDVEFTMEKLAGLRPGQVFSQRYDEQRDSSVDGVQTYAQFRAEACVDAS